SLMRVKLMRRESSPSQRAPSDSGCFVARFLLELRGALPTRARLDRLLDLAHRLALRDLLYHRDFARHPVDRLLVELALRIGGLRLRLRAVEVTHHLRNGDQIAGIDL